MERNPELGITFLMSRYLPGSLRGRSNAEVDERHGDEEGQLETFGLVRSAKD
jgi:hypothetical protein